MKKIVFCNHAEKRRKQRGFTNIEIECIIKRPYFKKKRLDGRTEVIGNIKNREIKVVYKEEKNYLNIISVMVVI